MDEQLNERLNYYLDLMTDDEDVLIVLHHYGNWLNPNKGTKRFEGF